MQVTRAIYVLLIGAAVGLGCSSNPKKTTTKKAQNTSKATDTGELKVAADEPNLLMTPMLAGKLVRVFRRSITTGVIQVHDERVGTDSLVDQRVDALLLQGWKKWPPSPAPEFVVAMAEQNPDYGDCPFLAAVSDKVTSPVDLPQKRLSCFASVNELELALAREAQLRFMHAQALPCSDLARFSRHDLQKRVKELRAYCTALGVHIKPNAALVTEERARQMLNTTLMRPISQ